MIRAEDLSQNLLLQISNLIDGNQAGAKELHSGGFRAENVQVAATVSWQFQGEYKEIREVGDKQVKTHFSHDLQQFSAHQQHLLQLAMHEQTLRAEFLANLAQFQERGLEKSDKPYCIHRFDAFSVWEDCLSCKGRGKITCSSCRGRGNHSCGACGGSGQQAHFVNQYNSKGQAVGTRTEYRSCSACGGSGATTCSSCSGRGEVRCKDCQGHGKFTITGNVQAFGYPTYQVSTNATFAQTPLEHLLNQSGVIFCQEKIAFDQVKSETINDINYFIYYGEVVLLEQHFQLQGKNYTCYAFSNPPYPFVKPAIFDDLFADEITFLEQTLPDTNKIDKKKAFTFFTRYANQPVLERTMREIAQYRSHENENLAQRLENICLGFISPTMATKLTHYLNQIMDKVSPVYSQITWQIFTFFILLATLLTTEHTLETSFKTHPISSIFVGLGATLLITLLFSALAWFISSVIIFWQRRKIPSEYRQKMRNREPFRRLLKIVLPVFLGAGIYGAVAAYGILPKWNGFPQPQIQQLAAWYCSDNSAANWCQNISEINTETTPTTPPAVIYSAEEKTRIIQQTLTEQGYSLKVDGKFGAQTRGAAVNYLATKGIQVANDIALDPLFEYFKPNVKTP
ncbi:hypothetical protein ACLSYY_05480 [[Pasteurella] aerogenes]